MNKVTLHGRLSKDVDYRTTGEGLQITKLTVVTDESYKDRNGNKVDKAEFHNVVFMGAKAEVINKYFKKGDGIIVEGKLTHRSYEDNEGQRKYITEIAGLGFYFPFGRKQENQSTQAERNEQPAEATADDLPF